MDPIKKKVILRHKAIECDLIIDNDGYVSLNMLLSLMDFKHLGASETIIREIVETCSKQRFSIIMYSGEDSVPILKIRANQGHSIANVIND
jgi:putative RNA 2'-phosphotransferase